MMSDLLSKNGLRLALIIGAGALLGACQQRQFVTNSFNPAQTGTEQFPINVERSEVKLTLVVPAGVHELTPAQKSEVSAFVSAYRRTAGGQIVVRAPSGTSNESSARNALVDIHSILEDHGIPRNTIRFVPYGNGSAGNPPVVLSYLGYKAVSAECRNWTRNLSVTAHNRVSPNFGCAFQGNIAAMVDDPRDLERDRAMDPASSERRHVVHGKYVKGEITGADDPNDNNGSVSEVGQ